VGTLRMPLSIGPLEARSAESDPKVPAAATPAPTPVTFRKRRRETWFRRDSVCATVFQSRLRARP
jgi:hypothetical protein